MGILHGLTKIHTVWLLDEQVTKGPGGALARSYVFRQTFDCRMVPLDPSKYSQLGVNGQEFPHTMYCDTDPNLIETSRLAWRNYIFRVTGVPKNPDGVGMFWKTMLVAKTADNGVNKIAIIGGPTPSEVP